jgi:hypothetical protein
MASPTGKADLRKTFPRLYTAAADRVAEVDVPAMSYLQIDGRGDPATSIEYRNAVEALFAVAYGVKFAVKKSLGYDYVVMPLEGLWSGGDAMSFSDGDRSNWEWTAMIAQPEVTTKPIFESVVEQTGKKKSLPSLSRLRMETLVEGLSLQVMHLGPYALEGPTVALLRRHAEAEGQAFHGRHHEIYLNAPDRTAPEQLKTILRQPVRAARVRDRPARPA